jgi:hypothetical protein
MEARETPEESFEALLEVTRFDFESILVHPSMLNSFCIGYLRLHALLSAANLPMVLDVLFTSGVAKAANRR